MIGYDLDHILSLATETGSQKLFDLHASLVEGQKVRSSIHSCTKCTLREGCKKPVPWSGMPGPVCGLGEAPGAEEDKENEPFVGSSGRSLRFYLKKAGLNCDSFVNTLCCRPPGNKIPNPQNHFISACRPNLAAQIQYLKPFVIVCFGSTALSSFLNRASIEVQRGQFFKIPESMLGHACFGFATYHPANACIYRRELIPEFESHLRHVAQVMKARELFGAKIVGGFLERAESTWLPNVGRKAQGKQLDLSPTEAPYSSNEAFEDVARYLQDEAELVALMEQNPVIEEAS